MLSAAIVSSKLVHFKIGNQLFYEANDQLLVFFGKISCVVE